MGSNNIWRSNPKLSRGCLWQLLLILWGWKLACDCVKRIAKKVLIRLASLKLTALVILNQSGFKIFLKNHSFSETCFWTPLVAFAHPLYIRLGVLTGRRLSEKKGKKVLIRLALLKLTALVIPNQNGFNFYLKEHSCLNLFLHQSYKQLKPSWLSHS